MYCIEYCIGYIIGPIIGLIIGPTIQTQTPLRPKVNLPFRPSRFHCWLELYEIIANHSGQKYDKVYSDSDRDYWMKAKEAKKYGMIDEVLTKK